jgi:hypothetical protein
VVVVGVVVVRVAPTVAVVVVAVAIAVVLISALIVGTSKGKISDRISARSCVQLRYRRSIVRLDVLSFCVKDMLPKPKLPPR